VALTYEARFTFQNVANNVAWIMNQDVTLLRYPVRALGVVPSQQEKKVYKRSDGILSFTQLDSSAELATGTSSLPATVLSTPSTTNPLAWMEGRRTGRTFVVRHRHHWIRTPGFGVDPQWVNGVAKLYTIDGLTEVLIGTLASFDVPKTTPANFEQTLAVSDRAWGGLGLRLRFEYDFGPEEGGG